MLETQLVLWIWVFLQVKCKIHYFLAIFCPLQPQCTVKKAWENKSFSQRVSLNFADDSVYMRTRAHLNEYLLNDVGKVYQGSYKTPIGRDWAFGQFEAAVLPAAFFLLDNSQLRPTERGNPIKVSRAISAMGKIHAIRKENRSDQVTLAVFLTFSLISYFSYKLQNMSCEVHFWNLLRKTL